MVISKYDNLAHYLAGRKEDMIRMRFSEIEKLIEGPLPQVAYDHRAWWANSDTNNHAINGWLQAGWETSRVDMDNRELLFVRRAPALQYQFALPSRRRSDAILEDRSFDTMPLNEELNEILRKTGGPANLARMIEAVERYILGDLLETELGRILRQLWHRGS